MRNSEIKEWGYPEINSVAELKKKEVVGNGWCLLEENMFVTSAVKDYKTWFQMKPAVFLLSLPKLL